MPSMILVLQVIVAFGLLNVWMIRIHKNTPYRGGSAQTLKNEFVAYGLPSWCFYLVGILKVSAAACLLIGIWIPSLVAPASVLIGFLMVGALLMHIKIRDPLIKSLPAFLVLIMVLVILKFSNLS